MSLCFVQELVVSPADPRVAFIVGTGKIHWMTQNSGETFTTIYTDYNIGGVRFHKGEPRHLLAVTGILIADACSTSFFKSLRAYVC